MAPGSSEHLHPATVAAAIFTAALGPEFANELAAYTVIFVGWFGGMLWGLAKLPDTPPWAGWRVRLAFVVGSLCAALFSSVALASIAAGIASNWVPGMTRADFKDFLFPVAAAIPAIGHNWTSLFSWSVGLIRDRLERKSRETL